MSENLQTPGNDPKEALKLAIHRDDLAHVQQLLAAHPELRHAPIGYGDAGPLTWAAECRGLPHATPGRLALAAWLIQTGCDVHQDGDAPLMRASLDGSRIPMMQLLVRHGANVNAAWQGWFPILFAPCETLDPEALAWLLAHGADPDCGDAALWQARGKPHPGTALDCLLGTYMRDPQAVDACIALVQQAGGRTQYDQPGVLATIRGDLTALQTLLVDDPSLIHRRYPGLNIGTTAGRLLTLDGATLLHIAAEFSHAHAVMLLLQSGADVNAPARIDANGIGGQTALFHAATQGNDSGLPVVRLLIAAGADLTPRCRLPGHYERPEELFEGTALDYARLFPLSRPDPDHTLAELLRASMRV
jgi:ankyrin repeat protein